MSKFKCFFGFHNWIRTHEGLVSDTRGFDGLATIDGCLDCTKRRANLIKATHSRPINPDYLIGKNLVNKVNNAKIHAIK